MEQTVLSKVSEKGRRSKFGALNALFLVATFAINTDVHKLNEWKKFCFFCGGKKKKKVEEEEETGYTTVVVNQERRIHRRGYWDEQVGHL